MMCEMVVKHSKIDVFHTEIRSFSFNDTLVIQENKITGI